MNSLPICIIGGGPAGLAAAESLSHWRLPVILVDAKPRLGSKFLVAGSSGLNLTFDTNSAGLISACAAAGEALAPALNAYPPKAVRKWAEELETNSFIGSSGKIFPDEQHAAGLLMRWVSRLKANEVDVRLEHSVQDIRRVDDHFDIRFSSDKGDVIISAQRVICALGGASWPQTGSTGSWQPILESLGIACTPLSPANCGIESPIDSYLQQQHAGKALKDLGVTAEDGSSVHGEAVLTEYGFEGNAIYRIIPAMRETLAHGPTKLYFDLHRRSSLATIIERLKQQKPKHSFPDRLRRACKLKPLAIALLRWQFPDCSRYDAEQLAQCIKRLPIPVQRLRPIAEAISTAGGVAWEALNDRYECYAQPGIHCIGEMVDWEAPTGGYLINTCLAMGWYLGEQLAEDLLRKPGE